jgi:hypothetical protein
MDNNVTACNCQENEVGILKEKEANVAEKRFKLNFWLGQDENKLLGC